MFAFYDVHLTICVGLGCTLIKELQSSHNLPETNPCFQKFVKKNTVRSLTQKENAVVFCLSQAKYQGKSIKSRGNY